MRESIEVIYNPDRETFYSNYVNKGRPVVIKGALEKWEAIKKWDLDFFYDMDDGQPLVTKKGDVSKGDKLTTTFGEYVNLLKDYENKLSGKQFSPSPPYLHDVPIFHLYSSLIKDVQPFPVDFFPKWYRSEWYNYVQFFMGGTNSLTPLHFDTLVTHNLFFQIHGHKKFTLISSKQKQNCYPYKWRWFKVDPRKPNYEMFPLFNNVEVREAIVEPGSIIYLPPGTLHQVEGLSSSISFNIDWHTKRSVAKGLLSLIKGSPIKNFRYNLIVFIGLYLKVPSKYIFRLYKSYLNYIS